MKKSELRQIIREEIQKLTPKKRINEGIVTDFITSIVMLTLSGKSKQIDGLIDPIGKKEVIKASNDFKKAVENYKNFLNRPDVKKELEASGKKAEDFPFYNL